MKALSLWQPHASLVGRGKIHETRSWQTSYRGPIAIHAAQRWTGIERDFCLNDPFCRVLEREGLLEITRDKFDFRLPLGAIIATAYLARIIPTEHCYTVDLRMPLGNAYYIDPTDYLFGNYEKGRFAWKLEKVQILAEPIPYRGAQGLFNIPDDLLKAA